MWNKGACIRPAYTFCHVYTTCQALTGCETAKIPQQILSINLLSPGPQVVFPIAYVMSDNKSISGHAMLLHEHLIITYTGRLYFICIWPVVLLYAYVLQGIPLCTYFIRIGQVPR